MAVLMGVLARIAWCCADAHARAGRGLIAQAVVDLAL